MGKISILDPLTANQIAAGEVVERPVSVIKELIENSIDAGSTKIRISLLEGGIKNIRVNDNGFGIGPEDLDVAIQRHATSKIRTIHDLNSLNTLGFRGEALPSIAAVSKMTISSRTLTSHTGYSIQVNGGEKGNIIEIGCPVGTEIIVDDLFYNTPVRKKFLRSSRTELTGITDLVERIAISRPEISFELIHEKKSIFKTPGNNNLLDAIYSVYGRDVARNMREVRHDNFPFIWGYISPPQITRSSRHYYNFFLNRRLIKSQDLTDALEEAYHTRLPVKRYPIAVLCINLSPELFDVNVHPAKLEVRFKDVFPIKEGLIESIKSTLHNPLVAIPQIKKKLVREETITAQQEIFHPYKLDYEEFKADKTEKVYTNEETYPYEIKKNYENEQKMPDESSKKKEDIQTGFFSMLQPMGQIGGAYIIASGHECLFIIDQHAAHERIRYEKIEECFSKEPSASSLLSVPLTIELTHKQTLWLIDNIIQLAELGFVIEHFGNNTFLLRGVPKWHIEGNSQELLLDILEKLGSGVAASIKDILSEGKLFSLACKSAVKANKFLTKTDIIYLIQQLDLVKNPYTCPHGRPIIISITYEEIKKKFLRT